VFARDSNCKNKVDLGCSGVPGFPCTLYLLMPSGKHSSRRAKATGLISLQINFASSRGVLFKPTAAATVLAS